MIFPSLNQKFLSPPEFFWNTELFPLSCSGNARQKNIRRKKWYPKRIHEKFSMQEVLFKVWSVPIEIFLVLWDKKIFVGETWYPPRNQKMFSETTESSQWIFSIIWDKNKFDGNLRYPLACPYVSSHSRVFLKPRWVSNESFRWCETKKYRRKNVISTSLIHKLFSPPKFFWNTELFPLSSFSFMRQKKCSTRKVISPANPKNFPMQNFSETMNSSQWNFLLMSD